MKKSIKVLTIILLMSILGCWDSWYDHHLIIGVDLKPAMIHSYGGYSSYHETDTLRTGIYFIVRRETVILAQNLNHFSLVQDCNATTRGLKWDNETLIDSYELWFNRFIIIGNDTIKSHENLFKNNAINNSITIIYKDNDSRGFEDFILFDDYLINDLKFESKHFVAYFKCNTSDNRELFDSTEVIIK
jgi:hypothetical protein